MDAPVTSQGEGSLQTRVLLKSKTKSTKTPRLNHKTPLAQAIVAGNSAALTDLLSAGADVNEISYFRGHQGYQEAPLHTAVRYGREDMVEALLSHNADVNTTSSRGYTPLLRATQRNSHTMNAIMCRLLDHHADPNAADHKGCTALFWAVKLRNRIAARELIKRGANVNTRTKVTTILHTAISVDCTIVTKLLLDNGADVNIRDEFSETPMFPAVRVANVHIAKMLIDRGCDVNAINTDFRTPLHLSASSVHNNPDLTQLLLDNRAHVNALDRYRNSPLVLSLRNFIVRPNFSGAKCLIQYGSNIWYENCASALEWTVEAQGNFDIVKYAVEAGFRLSGVTWVQDLLKGDHSRHPWFRISQTRETNFVDFLREKLLEPQSLQSLCRVTVRQHLIYVWHPKTIYPSIDQLPLPEGIKSFLRMDEDE